MKKIVSLLAATAVLATATAAVASTVTQTANFNEPQAISFSGFDASLGTLTAVSALLSGDATLPDGNIKVRTGDQNASSDSDNPAYIFMGNIDGRVTTLLGGLSFVPSSGFGNSLFGPGVFCETDAASTECQDSFGNTPTYRERNDEFSFTASASDLSAFRSPLTGSVSFETFVTVVEGSVIEGPSSSWTGSGSLELTYEYTTTPAPIPLPAALPLMLAGLGALGAFGIRRKRQG